MEQGGREEPGKGEAGGEGILQRVAAKERKVKGFFSSILNIKLNLLMGLIGLPGPPKLLLQYLVSY